MVHAGRIAALLLALSALPTQAETISNWQIVRQPSAMDGSANFGAVLYAQQSQFNPDIRPQLDVLCFQGETNVFFSMDTYLGREPVELYWRVDGGQVNQNTLSVATTGTAAGWWENQGTSFLGFLRNKHELAISLRAYDRDLEALFELDGIDRVVSEVRAACHW